MNYTTSHCIARTCFAAHHLQCNFIQSQWEKRTTLNNKKKQQQCVAKPRPKIEKKIRCEFYVPLCNRCARSIMDGFVIYIYIRIQLHQQQPTTAKYIFTFHDLPGTHTWIFPHLLFIWIMNECVCVCVAIECANKTSPIKNIKQPLKWNCIRWTDGRWGSVWEDNRKKMGY